VTGAARRPGDRSLDELNAIIDRMEELGQHAEDAAARVSDAVGATGAQAQARLVAAIGDVLEVTTERSRLAHRAHRLIRDMRQDAVAPQRVPDLPKK
jgi:hypothetical protein